MCQVLHCGRQLPITITLATIVSHTFPKEYEERRQEEREAGSGAGTSQSAPDAPAHMFQLPLFGGCGHECSMKALTRPTQRHPMATLLVVYE